MSTGKLRLLSAGHAVPAGCQLRHPRLPPPAAGVAGDAGVAGVGWAATKVQARRRCCVSAARELPSGAPCRCSCARNGRYSSGIRRAARSVPHGSAGATRNSRTRNQWCVLRIARDAKADGLRGAGAAFAPGQPQLRDGSGAPVGAAYRMRAVGRRTEGIRHGVQPRAATHRHHASTPTRCRRDRRDPAGERA